MMPPVQTFRCRGFLEAPGDLGEPCGKCPTAAPARESLGSLSDEKMAWCQPKNA